MGGVFAVKTGLFLWLTVAGAVGLHAQNNRLVADFDTVTPDVFSFKDEKGSLMNASSAYQDEANRKGSHLGIRYNITSGGWGGWGVVMKGSGAQGFRYLGFDLKGDKGGETFQIGIRDTRGTEKKRPITQYTDISTSWQRVLIPLSDFAGVDLSSLDNINIGLPANTQGRVFLDNIAFETPAEAVGAERAPVNKVLLDGFERTNPDLAYRTFSGDSSQLTLASSRILYDGDYAMEMQYRLLTERPWGTWVGALRQPPEPMDWSGADAVKVWVKGDGSENGFRVRFTAADGTRWESVNLKALADTRWTLLTFPLRDFQLVGKAPRESPPDLTAVRAYELGVVSPGSSRTSGAKVSEGRIYVDLLYLTGEGLRGEVVPAPAPGPVAPGGAAPKEAVQGLSAGNVDFTLLSYTEYFHSPETQSQVNNINKLIMTGKLNKFSARVEFGSQSQEFGQASVFVGSSVTATDNRFPLVESPSYQVFANNLAPQLSLITLGNQWIDYGPDVFAPVFGFKGLSGEGDWERINYHAFALKHSQNSFTLGGRGVFYWPNWRLTGHGVYYEQTGKLTSASTVSGGGLVPPEDPNQLKLERLAQDLVYDANLVGELFDQRLRLETTYGYNDFVRSGVGDFTDPFNPVFSEPIEPAYEAGGQLWRHWVRTEGWPWEGLGLTYGYRDVATGYKPHYRQIPEFYDDTDSDQWGHNLRLVQRRAGWVASVEYDDMQRHSNSAYFRHNFLWGLGHYGYRGVDLALNQSYRREIYKFTSDRSAFTTDKNEKVIATEIYLRAQLTPRLAGWVRPRQERIWQPVTNSNLTIDVWHSRLEFYIANNAKLFGEHRTSRSDRPENEQQGFPYYDNFVRVSFELTF